MPCYCCTICPSENLSRRVLHRIVTAVFEGARAGTKQLSGFPNIGPLVAELQSMKDVGLSVADSPDYQVCVPQPDKVLCVKEKFFEMFSEQIPEFWDVLNNFNEQHNPDGRRLVERTATEAVTTPSPSVARAALVPDSMDGKALNSLPDARRPQRKCQKSIHGV